MDRDENAINGLTSSRLQLIFDVLRLIHQGNALSADERLFNGAHLANLPTIELSAEELTARIQFSLENLGIRRPDFGLLERTWRDAIRKSTDGLTMTQLRKLADDCTSNYYVTTDIAERWRLRLTHALVQAGYAAVVPEEDADLGPDDLDLTGIGKCWPRELLTDPRYCQVQGLLPGLPLQLDDTWVELELIEENGSEVLNRQKSLLLQIEERSLQNSRDSFSIKSMLHRLGSLTLIIGDPGCGKSTFVNWVARESVRDQDSPFLLPLIVRLREYGLKWSSEQELLAFALRRGGVESDDQVTKWADALLKYSKRHSGQVLLLLDGFDEIPQDTELTRHLHEQIELLAAAGLALIVTSRPTAALPLVGPKNRSVFRIAELSPWTSENLLRRWCSAAAMQESQIGIVNEKIQQEPDLLRMSRNPFLLTCLCALAVKPQTTNGQLPTKRAELYEQCLRLMQTQRYRQQTREFTDSDLRQVGRLAFWLFTEAPDSPRYIFDLGDVEAACGETSFFCDVVQPSRLVGRWSLQDASLFFSHTTIHEFLIAMHLDSNVRKSSAGLDAKDLKKLIADEGFNPVWTEVFAFLASKNPSPESPQWQFAGRCVREPDRYFGCFLLVARWLKDADVTDGGQELLSGIDLREKLWECLHSSVDPRRFITAGILLDSKWFKERFEKKYGLLKQQGQDPATEPLYRELMRAMKHARKHEMSLAFVQELLNPESKFRGLPQEHRLSSQSLEVLRDEISSGNHSEDVTRRVIQVLGLAGDPASVPLLAGLAANASPLQSTAVEALGLLGGHSAFEVLDRLFSNAQTESDRILMIEGLGNMYDDNARKRLVKELCSVPRDEHLATEILCALQDHRLTRGETDVVLGFLESSISETRTYAATVLQFSTRSNEVAEKLVHVARYDNDSIVRCSALLSLEQQVSLNDFLWLNEIVRNEQLDLEEREAALMAIGGMDFSASALREKTNDLLRYCFRASGLAHSAIGVAGRVGYGHLQLLRDSLDNWIARIDSSNFPNQTLQPASDAVEPDSFIIDSDIVAEEICRELGDARQASDLDLLLAAVRNSGVPSRVREAAALAITKISPSRLIGESDDITDRVLGKFSLESARLIFGDTMLDEQGHWPTTNAKIQLKSPEQMSVREKFVEQLSEFSATSENQFRFEISLSFAGDKKRKKIREIVDKLKQELGEGKVFFDEYFQAEIAGRDADQYFQEVFLIKSRLVVSCVCKRYSQKVWTKHEWRAIRSFFSGSEENTPDRNRFLPIRFDDGEIEGLFSNIDIIPDVREMTTNEIVELILQRHKLCLNNGLVETPSNTSVHVSPNRQVRPFELKSSLALLSVICVLLASLFSTYQYFEWQRNNTAIVDYDLARLSQTTGIGSGIVSLVVGCLILLGGWRFREDFPRMAWWIGVVLVFILLGVAGGSFVWRLRLPI